eukprot:159009-Rhodomonas_salina.1
MGGRRELRRRVSVREEGGEGTVAIQGGGLVGGFFLRRPAQGSWNGGVQFVEWRGADCGKEGCGVWNGGMQTVEWR